MNHITIIIVLWIALATLAVAQSITVQAGLSQFKIIDYDVFKQQISISSKVDFANVKVTFDDLDGQSVTIKELRDWVRAQHKKPGIK